MAHALPSRHLQPRIKRTWRSRHSGRMTRTTPVASSAGPSIAPPPRTGWSEAGLSEAREELIGAMWRHYPAAARRILAGMRSAVDEAGSPR